MYTLHTLFDLPKKVDKLLLYRPAYSDIITVRIKDAGDFFVDKYTLIQYLKNLEYIGVDECIDMLWNFRVVEVDINNCRHMCVYDECLSQFKE